MLLHCLQSFGCYIVTPGIAALTTRKEPVKFIKWFSSFQIAVLKDASLSTEALNAELGCREADPSSLISKIMFPPGSRPLLLAEDLSLMVPKWRNVIQSGCSTDLEAIDHLLYTVHPILSDYNVPKHMKFEADPFTVGPALSGRSMPASSGVQNVKFIGCKFDSALLKVPNIMIEVASSCSNITVSHAYEVYREHHIQDIDPVKTLTPIQLSILYAWTYPVHFAELYMKSFLYESNVMFFEPIELYILKPLASAILGIALDDPPCLNSLKQNRFQVKNALRFENAMNMYEASEDPRERRKAQKMMKNLAKKENVSVETMKIKVAKVLREAESEAGQPTEDVASKNDLGFIERCLDSKMSDDDDDAMELEIDPKEMDLFLLSSP